jgi:hypothetical protein
MLKLKPQDYKLEWTLAFFIFPLFKIVKAFRVRKSSNFVAKPWTTEHLLFIDKEMSTAF